MKKKLIPLCLILLLNGSCSSTTHLKEAYNRGFEEGIASEVKRSYWETKEFESQQPVEEPLEKVFYEIPVPEHTTEDGVIIEGHSKVIEIVQ